MLKNNRIMFSKRETSGIPFITNVIGKKRLAIILPFCEFVYLVTRDLYTFATAIFIMKQICVMWLILLLQIIECRRVLKWTFAYGYYLHEQEPAKKDFFTYLQGEADSGLERLHRCAEFELKPFLTGVEEEGPPIAFEQFRQKIHNLTKVTKTYFDNLVKALENGLVDVEHNVINSTTNSIYSTKRQKF